jgi:hypothetical protein
MQDVTLLAPMECWLPRISKKRRERGIIMHGHQGNSPLHWRRSRRHVLRLQPFLGAARARCIVALSMTGTVLGNAKVRSAITATSHSNSCAYVMMAGQRWNISASRQTAQRLSHTEWRIPGDVPDECGRLPQLIVRTLCSSHTQLIHPSSSPVHRCALTSSNHFPRVIWPHHSFNRKPHGRKKLFDTPY